MVDKSAERVAALVRIHFEAKSTNIAVFTCTLCKKTLSYKDMAKVDCYCCGQGICIKCKEDE